MVCPKKRENIDQFCSYLAEILSRGYWLFTRLVQGFLLASTDQEYQCGHTTGMAYTRRNYDRTLYDSIAIQLWSRYLVPLIYRPLLPCPKGGLYIKSSIVIHFISWWSKWGSPGADGDPPHHLHQDSHPNYHPTMAPLAPPGYKVYHYTTIKV